MHWNRDNKIFNWPEDRFDFADIPHVVLAPGCFDLLHYSHIDYLQRASLLGDKLYVALNSDRSVSYAKPGRPFISQKWRARQLVALEVVTGVILFDEPTPVTLIEWVRPKIVVCGAEWIKENPLAVVAAENFGQVVYLPASEDNITTTELVRRLQSKPQEA
jgi:D-beta-D-heptose 7-phosphate kinase/D-beta-D-heptose 1-phosphate adenosyltransferase